MIARKRIMLMAMCLAAPLAVRAQSSPANPVVASAQEIVERQSKYIAAAADAMPAEKYGYRPTPDQWTFEKIVSHIAQSDFNLCAILSDTPGAAELESQRRRSQGQTRPSSEGVPRFLLAGAGQPPGFEAGRHGQILRRPSGTPSQSPHRIDRRPRRPLLAASKLPADERNGATLGEAR